MATRSNIGRVIMQNVNETLTQYDVKGGKGVLPRLAESWEDQGNGTWRFNLRQGVTFSDGTAFDANDVKHSFERVVSDQITCETPRYFGDTKLSFNVVDDHTIDVTADPAQPILPLLLSLVTIVPSETPIEFVREPVGTGPYKLARGTRARTSCSSARDDYWGEAPAVEKATYVFRSDPAVAAAMVTQGEADLAPSIAAVDATNPETDVSYLNSETLYLRIDSAIAPISDKRVREALNLAIDREAFIGTLLPEGVVSAAAMVPPTTLGWNPDVKPFPYDPGEGQGAARAGQGRRRAGRHHALPDRPLEPLPRRRRGGRGDAADAAGRRLQRRGADGRGRPAGGALLKPFKEGRPPQMLAVQHDNSRGDPVFSMYFKYASKGRQSGIADPKVDELIAKATAATGEERAKLWPELRLRPRRGGGRRPALPHGSFARVGERIDFTPTIATNSQLELADIAFK